MIMNYQIFILFFCENIVNGLYFNVNKVIELRMKDGMLNNNNSYFGYSLLLRKGTNPRVIVGVPNSNKKKRGVLFFCDILTRVCTQTDNLLDDKNIFNGNFLGISMDGSENEGEPFVVCAPRCLLSFYRVQRGICVVYNNSSPLNKSIPIQRYVSISNKKLFEMKILPQSLQLGFDIVYDKETNTVLAGAVGYNGWKGCLVKQPTIASHEEDTLFIPSNFNSSQEQLYVINDYLGYKVGYATFKQKKLIVSGAPRGANLNGKVMFFDNTSHYQTIVGNKIGTLFGASLLAVDVNNDKSEEFFVGAPTDPGSSYDEGCVYYYNDILNSDYTLKLTGNGKSGARFGTNIVSLGDINFDSYNDVAIAAPFDDDGVGAVYIYFGSSNGISLNYTEKLSPSTFSINPLNVRGFGVGLSKGVDIDNNGLIDVAVGAYLSQHVFVITTNEVIKLFPTLNTSISSLNLYAKNVTAEYCVRFQPKYINSTLKSVKFELTITSSDSTDQTVNITCPLNVNVCNTINIQITKRKQIFFTFEVSLITKVIGNIVAEGKSKIDHRIPFAHGCGEDNVCQTKITLDAQPTRFNIEVGQTKNLDIKLIAKNVGQPGYQCDLFVNLPKELELHSCGKNGSYTCLFTNYLNTNTTKEKVINFSLVNNILPSQNATIIEFEIKCYGKNMPREIKAAVALSVTRQSNIYVNGFTEFSEFSYPSKNELVESNELIHYYTLQNFGPSPIKTNVHLLVPILKIDKENVIEVVQQKDKRDRICKPIKHEARKEIKYNAGVIKVPLEKTIVVDCFEHWKCMEYLCEGERLERATNNLQYKLNIKINAKLLEKFLHSQSTNKKIITIVTSAFAFNGTFVGGHVTTEFYFSLPTTIAIWIYIVSIIAGCILVAIMIFVLFKMNFFKRNYKEKMAEEKDLVTNNADQSEPLQVFDDIEE